MKIDRYMRPWVSKELTGKIGKMARRWKGDDASYIAKHMWITKHYGKNILVIDALCKY